MKFENENMVNESSYKARKLLRKTMAMTLATSMVFGGAFSVQAAGLKDVFDAKAYSETYSDLSAAFGTNEEALFNHYLTYGITENRVMNELIDVKKYREANPDLDAAFGDNWDAYVNHYLQCGAAEGRDSFGTFDAEAYANRYADLKAAFGYDTLALWQHYVQYGRAEGRIGTTHTYPIVSGGAAASEDVASMVTMTGRIVDPETGAPVANATITVAPTGDTPVMAATIVNEGELAPAEDEVVVKAVVKAGRASEESELTEDITEDTENGEVTEDTTEDTENGEVTEDTTEDTENEEVTEDVTEDETEESVVDDPYTTVTDENGNYSLELLEGTYSYIVTADGYIALTMNSLVVNADSSSVVPTVTLLSESVTGETRITGTLTDALNGEGIEGATVELRAGWSNYSGDPVVVATTDAEGNYNVAVERGYYTATYIKDGYVTKSQNVVSVVNFTSYLQNEAMTPAVAAESYRIVLTWGETPRDLDSHITGPAADGTAFHVCYWNEVYEENGEAVVTLDHDDVTSYGPETVTVITPQDNAIYRYSVHQYSSDGELSLSGATVVVYSGSEQIAAFSVPVDGDGDIWHVFEIRDGQLVVLNTFSEGDSSSASYYPEALYTE